MKALGKVIKYFNEHLEESICAILLSLIIILQGNIVFMRFFLGRTSSWQEEITGYLYVWLTYIGFSLSAKRFAHIRITTLVDILPQKWRDRVLILADFIWLVFNLIIVIISIELLKTLREFPMISGVLQWDMFWIYIIIPIGFFLGSLRMIQHYYYKIKN